MTKFGFLKQYIDELPASVRDHPELPYSLNSGIHEEELIGLEKEFRISVPPELREFYAFSNGALLGEYKILTLEEIVSLREDLISTYEDLWKESVLPFAYVMGVGDVVAFDLSESSEAGVKILDGFHEDPPVQWKSICYGLITWFKEMTNSSFEPFWLGQ